MPATSPERRLGVQSLTRLLGDWRTPPGATRPASYRELADRVELLVVDGRVAPGSRLPAERELADALALSRTTIAGAYSTLRERGLLRSVRGSGSVVSTPAARASRTHHGPAAAADLSHAVLPGWEELPHHFARAAEQLPSLLRTHALDFYGAPELRAAVAGRYTRRGVPTTPGQILITLGAQHALGLVLRAFCSPGDRVAVDLPTYPHALDAIRDARARFVPVAMTDDERADVTEWEQTLAAAQPALAYLMPDFHNPTGGSMTDLERERLLAAAARSGTILIADETTAELDIDRAGSTTPLAGIPHSRASTVVSLGSASKTIWHGLRIGWIRADTAAIDRIAAHRPASDLGTPVLEQLVVADVLPEMDRLLAARRTHLTATRTAVIDVLQQRLPSWRVPVVDGGLSLWAGIGSPASSTLALTARTRGLTITSGPRFGLDGAFERHIRIPITASADSAAAAVGLLADAWDAMPPPLDTRHDFSPML